MPWHRLLKPKWKHPDPSVRRKAVADLQGEGATILLQLAETDPDDSVRAAAIERLSDLEALCRLASGSGRIPEAARARLHRLVTEADPGPLSPELARTLLGLVADAALSERLARNAPEPAVRCAAAEAITDQQLAAELACNDASGEVRYAAALQVQDPGLLQRLERHGRQRDKRVARLARQRLHDDQARRQRAAQRGELLQAMEALAQEPDRSDAAGQWRRIQEQWDAIAAEADEQELTRFGQLAEMVQHGLEAARARHQKEQQLKADKEALLAELQALTQGDAIDADASRMRLGELEQAWAEQTRLANEAIEQDLQHEFERLASEARERMETDRLAQARAQLEGLRDRVRALAQSATPDRDRVEAAKAELSQAAQEPRLADLHQETRSLIQRLEQQRQETQARQHQEESEAIRQALDRLDEALEARRVKAAEHHYNRAHKLIESSQLLSSSQHRRLQRRLQAGLPLLRELRNWRHWSTDQVRHAMIEEAEALVGADLPAETIAERVKALRERWKQLGKMDPSAHALWKRFDDACERAFQPVLAEREALAQRRREHLEARQAICAELEALAQETDWAAPEWRQIDRRVQRLRRAWREAGEVEHRDWRAIKRRFDAAMDALEAHLGEERQRNLRQREDLIARARALSEEPDRHKALREAKELQRAWQPTVTARPRDERRLWREFKSAIDAVYDRDRRERMAAEQTLVDNLAQCQELCQQLETLSDLDAEALLARRHEVQGIEQAFRAAGEVPRGERQGLRQRFDQALAAFRQAEAGALQTWARVELERLAQKAALCHRLEAMGSEDPQVLSEVLADWDALPAQDDAQVEDAIGHRFATARAAAEGDSAARQALEAGRTENLAAKQRICLDLEILLEISSPEPHQEERLERQVERLAETMPAGGHHHPQREPRIRDLLTRWHLTGPVPEAAEAGLAQRFARIERHVWAEPQQRGADTRTAEGDPA